MFEGWRFAASIFPIRKPNGENNNVAGQENAKENHDKNYCATRHEAIAAGVAQLSSVRPSDYSFRLVYSCRDFELVITLVGSQSISRLVAKLPINVSGVIPLILQRFLNIYNYFIRRQIVIGKDRTRQYM